MEELKGLINKELWSAPSDMSSPQILLAVSGGMDSMCMADLFFRLYGNTGLAIAHCNFNLRGEESDSDEAMVREWAGSRGIRSHFVSFDTHSYAEGKGISIEMAARELRYAWFAEVCRQYGYAGVSVAHHSEDNAETLLLNMVRGTGLKGLSGMKQFSVLPFAGEEDRLYLIRPLLGFTRKQIEGYVFARKLTYRTDSSNFSLDYKRNRIRHEVFPSLHKLNPSFVATFNREMMYFSDAEAIVSDWCRKVAEGIVDMKEDGNLEISIGELMKYGQWRYLLYHILEPYGFNSSVLTSIEELLLSDRTVSGKSFRSSTHNLLTGRGCLCVTPLADEDDGGEIVVNEDGRYAAGTTVFVVETLPWSSDMPVRQPEGVVVFDADKLTFPFVCRKWKQGDWFIPLGMRGRKKISDLFNDLKYNAEDKRRAVIISLPGNSGSIAGLLGERIDDRYKITSSTRRIVKMTRI